MTCRTRALIALGLAAVLASPARSTVPMEMPPQVIQHIGTHTGTINGGPFQIDINGTADRASGLIQASATIVQAPPGNFHFAFAGISWFSISCSNNWRWFSGSSSSACSKGNIATLLGGLGSYTHTRTYTYPEHPGNSLSVTANFSLNGGTLTYNGSWTGNTPTLPTDIVGVTRYRQTLTPGMGGTISVAGSAHLVRSGGGLVPIAWTGMYSLPASSPNLGGPEEGFIELGFSTADNVHFNLSGSAIASFMGPPCGVLIPTLSEWGMGLLAVMLLGAGALLVFRRRGASGGQVASV